MSRIFITGDTHGDFKKISYRNWPESRELTRNDILIVTGDFGLVWDLNLSKTEMYWINFLEARHYDIYFIDGNHENFDRLNKYPTVKRLGSDVHQIANNVFHMKRGHVYKVEDKKILAIGGAASTDKAFRTPNVSWWPEETLSTIETNITLDNIETEKEVDYVITHTAPSRCLDELLGKLNENDDTTYRHKDNTVDFLDVVDETLEFKKWFFGHFHEEWKSADKKYNCLFNNIEEIL
jgi:predicted phosphodiesterase